MTTSDALSAALADRYTIIRQIGQGGMASVYLAEDVRHERKVALKVLLPELAAVVGADRFLKEVKTTANLQHPHILPLHDSGEAAGSVFYVMPCVEGESLRDRIKRERQLPIDESVRIARETLSALDYAHRHGVVHRDIKPENILLHDGQALVADFGIALAVSSAGADTRLTETGLSLGTPHYMSPEQAMGERDITGRCDVYSAGCVLYEMLIGEAPFTGPTAQSIIARVITDEPRSLVAQRKTIPQHVEAAVLRAMAKVPADRFASAAEFSDALGRPVAPGSIAFTSSAPASVGRAVPWKRSAVMGSLGVAAVSLAVAAATLAGGDPPATGPLMRFEIRHSDANRLAGVRVPLAISPDGQVVAVTMHRPDGTQVYARRLGDRDMRPVAGTEGATSVTFSADGNWIVFSRGATVYKVLLGGGPPTKVLDVPWADATTSWAPDGSILVGSSTGGAIHRAPHEGAPLEPLTVADTARGERGHTRPVALPSGKFAVFDVGREDGTHAALLSLEARTWMDLGLGVADNTAYSAGHLVYRQANRVMAVPFDVDRGQITGTPAVVDSVIPGVDTPAQVWSLAASPNGTIVYAAGPGGADDIDLLLVDRSGGIGRTSAPRDRYNHPRFSPSGDAVAYQGTRAALDVVNLRTGGVVRLARAPVQLPEWSPDGRHIAYGDGLGGLWVARADGSAEPVRIVASRLWPYSWSPDGNAIGAYASEPGGRDIVIVRRTNDGTWQPSTFLATPANERSPAISPNGRWIAYASDESGIDEIYVRSFPSGDGRRLVSRGGGREPAWSRDGRELVYRRGREIISVPVNAGTVYSPGQPTRLFGIDATMSEGPTGERDWDVTRDGRRFLFMQSPRATSPFALHLVVNFPAALPAGR